MLRLEWRQHVTIPSPTPLALIYIRRMFVSTEEADMGDATLLRVVPVTGSSPLRHRPLQATTSRTPSIASAGCEHLGGSWISGRARTSVPANPPLPSDGACAPPLNGRSLAFLIDE